MNRHPNDSLSTRTQRLVAVFLALFVCAPLADAHPGHSLSEATPAHLLTSPDHLAALVLIGAAMCLWAQLVNRRLPRRALQFAGSIAILSALVRFSLLP
ncbi:MAG: hypothetical protein HZA89_10260 [Verrucomicrobia bacterium]|nr:hypothetical protein [Verrucomicrobiota bacterium]